MLFIEINLELELMREQQQLQGYNFLTRPIQKIVTHKDSDGD